MGQNVSEGLCSLLGGKNCPGRRGSCCHRCLQVLSSGHRSSPEHPWRLMGMILAPVPGGCATTWRTSLTCSSLIFCAWEYSSSQYPGTSQSCLLYLASFSQVSVQGAQMALSDGTCLQTHMSILVTLPTCIAESQRDKVDPGKQL